ncbi:formate dehydrogenase accessory sulfurtransferase FdhD [soil metagenome]
MKAAPGLSELPIRRVVVGTEDADLTDVLAVEEPLEIILGMPENGKIVHQPVSITMRTPGADFELAAGFLFTEGILSDAGQIAQIRHFGVQVKLNGLKNTVIVELNEGVKVDLKRLERNFYMTSSCGVCGKSSIEALHTGVKKVESGFIVNADLVHTLTELLRASQNVFDRTGGLHASALFYADGNLEIVREDVGRHNALDKVIGAKFLSGELPLTDRVLLVSGRVSFELVQKALMAGIPILAAIGAPSSLAVELAEEYGMTLVGFVRDGRFNIYTAKERIKNTLHTGRVSA